MAVKGTEIEILKSGMDYSTLDKKSAWLQNLQVKQGSLWVRKGFGQLHQIDTTLKTGTNSKTWNEKNVGATQHLGTHYVKTAFGNEQFLTLTKTDCYTANIRTDNNYAAGDTSHEGTPWNNGLVGSGDFIRTYTLHIYDKTLDKSWEEVIYKKSSQEIPEDLLNLNKVYPHYQTIEDDERGIDNTRYISADDDADEVALFTDIGNAVVFGAQGLGLHIYNPVVFNERQDTAHNRFYDWNTYEGKGEASYVIPFKLTDLSSLDGFDYLLEGEIQNVSAISLFRNRLAIAAGKRIYFTNEFSEDKLFAFTAIQTDNFVEIDAPEPIVAIKGFKQFLWVFTENNTYIYNSPNPDTNVGQLSGGVFVNLSTTTGCLNNRSLVETQNSFIWCDKNGVYATSGTATFQKISDRIDPFFRDFITNPLTNFFTLSGVSDDTLPQPRMVYDFAEREQRRGVKLDYNPNTFEVFMSIPYYGITWVFKEGDWFIWSFESVRDPLRSPTDVAKTENLQNTEIVVGGSTTYVVGCFDDKLVQNQTYIQGYRTDGTECIYDGTYKVSSYYLCELGRGGAADRSVGSATYKGSGTNEDTRFRSGEWVADESNTGNEITDLGSTKGVWYFGKPVRRNPFRTSDFPANDGFDPQEPVYLVPVYYKLPADIKPETIDELSLRVYYDNSKWKPLIENNGNATPAIIFEEGVAASLFYGTANATQIRVLDQANAPDPDGIKIDLVWNRALIPPLNTTFGASNGFTFQRFQKNLMFWLPMKRRYTDDQGGVLSGFDDQDTFSIGWKLDYDDPTNNQVALTDSRATPLTAENTAFFYYSSNEMPETRRSDRITTGLNTQELNPKQPVDWVVSGENIGIDGIGKTGTIVLKARGLYLQLISTGIGSSTYSLMSILLGSDWKLWSSQIVDYLGPEQNNEGKNISIDFETNGLLRKRFQPSLTGDITERTFRSGAQTGDTAATYDNSPAQVGNYLTDERELDTIAVSDSVKGENLHYVLYGHAYDKATELQMKSAKAVVKVASQGRRRKGRGIQ